MLSESIKGPGADFQTFRNSIKFENYIFILVATFFRYNTFQLIYYQIPVGRLFYVLY